MKEEAKPWTLTVVMAVRVLIVLTLLGVMLWQMRVPAQAADVNAGERMVIPLGRAVGIKLFSDGVVVVGLSEIETGSGAAAPAKDCGLKAGDVITSISGSDVDTIEEVQAVLQETAGEPVPLVALRGGDEMSMTVQAVQCSADGAYKLGAWIRDSMAGIGTLTFADASTGQFGALGHGISDLDTSLLMPLENGSIMPAEVSNVQKGVAGTPGQLKGEFDVSANIGNLAANTGCGIFGTLNDASLLSGKAVPVARRGETDVGAATILSNISGDTVKEYDVEIVKVYAESETDSRDYMIRVTDPELLKETGGIVQGMSGSPILQNGKLIGAVTHVLVGDPTCGYAISAERMLAQAEECAA